MKVGPTLGDSIVGEGVVVISCVVGIGGKGVMVGTCVVGSERRGIGLLLRRGIRWDKGKGDIDQETGLVVNFRDVAVLNISASLCDAHKLGLENSKGEAGDGFCRIVTRSSSALVVASAEDVRSIGKLYGKKTTVSESRCELVAGM